MANTENNNGDFLGSGWCFPLAILNEGLALSQGNEDILQSVLLILGTVPGERVMLPEFGCSMNELVFAPANSVTATLAENYVTEALQQWEPRITDIEAQATYDTKNPSRLNVHVGYVVRSSNVEQNLVYPFYLQGGGNLPPDYQKGS
jgi:phage baseplate assembly protein W